MSTEGGHSPSHTCVLQQPQTQARAGVWLLGSAEYGTLRAHTPTTNHCVSLFKEISLLPTSPAPSRSLRENHVKRKPEPVRSRLKGVQLHEIYKVSMIKGRKTAEYLAHAWNF